MTDNKLSIEELIDSVEKDNGDSKIKDAAKLFLAAMTDWPTLNQTSLNEFIKEFKIDFGDSFTVEELEQKRTRDNWKAEAKNSLVEMLKLYPTITFDDIIGDILAKYLMK